MKTNKNNYTLDKYIEISKTDILVYLIVFIIALIISLYISFKQQTFFYLIFISIIPTILLIGRIKANINLNNIKKYITKNNLKYEKIIYYNEQNYILTDIFMILINKNKVSHFNYTEIKEIYKKRQLKLGKPSSFEEYLYITLLNNKQYKILIDTIASISVQETIDFSNFLLEQNPNIKIKSWLRVNFIW